MQDIINRLRAKKDDEGFTLIELLVVVVIIGVLVAIAVPVYLNYREGAADKSAQSDVRGAVSAIEQYCTDHNNAYPTITGTKTATFPLDASAPDTSRVTLSDNTEMVYTAMTGGGYRVCAKNKGGSGKVYMYDSTTGGSVKAVAGTTPVLANCSTLAFP
jgi:type IV pilus assembly protein PilA